MRKSIAAILTAMAMVVALVLPMTAFADEAAPAGKSAKTYDEKYVATKDEPDYDVVVPKPRPTSSAPKSRPLTSTSRTVSSTSTTT